MKAILQEFMRFRPVRPVAALLAVLLGASTLPLSAQTPAVAGADAKKTEAKSASDAVKDSSAEDTGEYNNWVTIGVGQMFVDGDHAQFQRRHQLPDQTFGGIEELHYEQAIGKKGMFKLDTRGILDNHDFALKLDVSHPDKGFVRAGYREFRTWYDGSGGYFPTTGAWRAPNNEELHVDRREFWVEAGLTLPDWPVFTVKYSYETRNGQKDSTIWGDSTAAAGAVRGIVPSFRDINERRHIIQADGRHTIGKTEFAIGLRYELSDNDNSLNIRRRPGEAADRYVTQKEGVDTDLFNVHAFTETRLSEIVLFTVAYAFTTLDTDTSGSRIYGGRYDAPYLPAYPGIQARDEGFVNLSGGSRVNQHVANLNFMLTPWENFALVPALRIESQDQDGLSSFIENSTAGAPPVPTAPVALTNYRNRSFIDVSESLEARYTGIQKWSFYARAEWTEGQGNLRETEREGVADDPLLIVQNTDSDRLVQKYVTGANWYPTRKLNLGAQYYYKIRQNDYNHIQDSAIFAPPAVGNLYPAFIRQQDFDTHDMNLRVTWRALANVTLVSRYDFQLSTVDMQGDINNLGIALQERQSSEVTSHIFSESMTWSPLARLALQATMSYVLDRTDSGADFVGGGAAGLVLPSRNNYMTGNFFATYALSDKTDLQAQYFYYRADNYVNNAAVSQPYGVGAEEHAVTGSVLHRIRKNLLWKITYGFFSNHDQTSGGNNDYTAHMVYSSLQYRF